MPSPARSLLAICFAAATLAGADAFAVAMDDRDRSHGQVQLKGGLASRALAEEPQVVLASECPDGYSPVTENIYACRAAMALVDPGDQEGGGFQGTEKDRDWPSGCYFCDGVEECSDGTWFNNEKKGNNDVSGVKRYCAKDMNELMKETRVLFLGDSDVEFWPTTETKYTNSNNLGVGGYTCSDVLKEVRQKKGSMLKSFGPPDIVVLVCGENDLAFGRSVGKTFKSAKSIIKLVQKTGAKVIYLGTKPEPSTKNLHKKYREYDEKMQKLAVSSRSTENRLVMINSYKAFEALGNPNSLYRKDKLHLSSEGYSLWDTWTQTALNDLSSEDTCIVWESNQCVVAA